MVVRHKCDQPLCINPEHLTLGTHLENARDAMERGRLPKGPGSNPRKLTSKDVITIQGLRWFEKWKQRELAVEYSVSMGTIQDVLSGKTWPDAHEQELQ